MKYHYINPGGKPHLYVSNTHRLEWVVSWHLGVCLWHGPFREQIGDGAVVSQVSNKAKKCHETWFKAWDTNSESVIINPQLTLVRLNRRTGFSKFFIKVENILMVSVYSSLGSWLTTVTQSWQELTLQPGNEEGFASLCFCNWPVEVLGLGIWTKIFILGSTFRKSQSKIKWKEYAKMVPWPGKRHIWPDN